MVHGPFIVEITRFEQIHTLLRPLARADLSPLPLRMRHRLAYLIHLSRILRRNPDPDGFVARFALMGQDPPVLTDCL